MNSDLKDLLRLNKTHTKPAAAVLNRAFHNYPLLRYYYPDEPARDKIGHYFFHSMISYTIRYGEVYATSPDLEGIAAWLASDKYPMTFLRLLRSVPLSVIFGLGKEGAGKMKHTGEYIDAVHKRLVPYRHWFLQVIGVDPQYQGKGYAGKLLGPMLTRIDGEGLPCYLETMEEKNVGLYEHFGFRVIEKSSIPRTVFTNWAMLIEKPG